MKPDFSVLRKKKKNIHLIEFSCIPNIIKDTVTLPPSILEKKQNKKLNYPFLRESGTITDTHYYAFRTKL